MPSRSDRRRRPSGSKVTLAEVPQASITDVAQAEAKALLASIAAPEQTEEVSATPHGISILKEIFPEHGEGDCAPGKKETPGPLLEQLGRLPSPARMRAGCGQPGGSQWNGSQPPSTQWTGFHQGLASSLPAQNCQGQLEMLGAPAPPEAAAGSYRERLRLGGRGAFQRAFDAGYMPKTVKQESQWSSTQQESQWSAPQAPPNRGEGYWAQQVDVQTGTAMPYGTAGDTQMMWGGIEQVQNTDCWGMSMNQTQMRGQFSYMQQVPDMQQHMAPPMMGGQQQQQHQPDMQPMMQMMPMAQGDQSLQMMTSHPQMQMTQGTMPQMSPSPMSSMSPSPMSSGESTPADFDRCMAIASGGADCDKDLIALQLRAAAELQDCYED